MDFLQDITNIVGSNEENAWQKASASLDATAKIYGYRVDSVHTDTYKILGGLNRNELKEEEDENNDGDNPEAKAKKEKKSGNKGVNTLEKDHKKLDLKKFHLDYDVDPLFKTMTAKFADTGAKSLLLNALPLNENMDIQIESKMTDPSGKLLDKEGEELIIECGNDINANTSEINEAVNDFGKENDNDQFMDLKIAPALDLFKQSRFIDDGKRNNERFFEKLEETLGGKQGEEIKQEDDDLDNIDVSSFHSEDNFSISAQDDQASDISEPVDDSMPLDNFMPQNGMKDQPAIQGFTMFRHEDIVEHEKKFGTGGGDILLDIQNFNNFTRGFSLIDKGRGFKGVKKDKPKKAKKEEKPFDISIDNKIEKKMVFGKGTTKMRGKTGNKVKTAKRKVKYYFNSDKKMLFHLFCLPDNRYVMNSGGVLEIQEDPGNADLGDIPDGVDGDGEMPREDEPQNELTKMQNEAFTKFDQEYAKNFGNLYKRFDIRKVKTQLWNSFNSMQEQTNQDEINFETIVKDAGKNLDEVTMANISSSTCFVCLLHLCNEKSKIILILFFRFGIKTE
ncbi:MAG: hypothetical protein MJ252_17960 [archaeon]|nr:hypothetical protein [archaeon]